MKDNKLLVFSYEKFYDYYKTYMKQRTDSFNFFILLEALLGNIIAILINNSSSTAKLYLLLVLVLFYVLPLLFYGLDKRTKLFIGNAKEEMKKIEKCLNTQNEFEMVMNLDSNVRNKFDREKYKMRFKMTFVFGCTYLLFSFFGVVTFVFVLLYF